MISQKEKLVFGTFYTLFAIILVACGIIHLISGSFGLAVFVLGVGAFDIFHAVESFRSWFRYREIMKTWKPIIDEDEDETFEDIYDDLDGDINGEE
jgi:hypothetical protein